MLRRSLNISLQSKRYSESINRIVNEWEEEGLNMSTEACEALLLVDKFKNLSTLDTVMNIIKMLESLSDIYHFDNDQMDDMLAKIIAIDHIQFSKILIELNGLKVPENAYDNVPKTYGRLTHKPCKKKKLVYKKEDSYYRKVEEFEVDEIEENSKKTFVDDDFEILDEQPEEIKEVVIEEIEDEKADEMNSQMKEEDSNLEFEAVEEFKIDEGKVKEEDIDCEQKSLPISESKDLEEIDELVFDMDSELDPNDDTIIPMDFLFNS